MDKYDLVVSALNEAWQLAYVFETLKFPYTELITQRLYGGAHQPGARNSLEHEWSSIWRRIKLIYVNDADVLVRKRMSKHSESSLLEVIADIPFDDLFTQLMTVAYNDVFIDTVKSFVNRRRGVSIVTTRKRSSSEESKIIHIEKPTGVNEEVLRFHTKSQADVVVATRDYPGTDEAFRYRRDAAMSELMVSLYILQRIPELNAKDLGVLAPLYEAYKRLSNDILARQRPLVAVEFPDIAEILTMVMEYAGDRHSEIRKQIGNTAKRYASVIPMSPRLPIESKKLTMQFCIDSTKDRCYSRRVLTFDKSAPSYGHFYRIVDVSVPEGSTPEQRSYKRLPDDVQRLPQTDFLYASMLLAQDIRTAPERDIERFISRTHEATQQYMEVAAFQQSFIDFFAPEYLLSEL